MKDQKGRLVLSILTVLGHPQDFDETEGTALSRSPGGRRAQSDDWDANTVSTLGGGLDEEYYRDALRAREEHEHVDYIPREYCCTPERFLLPSHIE